MTTYMRLLTAAALALALGYSAWAASAEDTPAVALSPPQTDAGKPLMQALKSRHSARQFSSRPLPDQVLSNLLWAAFGINRPQSGGRTAPSAHGWQEIDVYVVTSEGAYLYEAQAHALKLVARGDFRGKTGVQPFVSEAPLNLVYVADFSRMGGASDADKRLYSGADAGFIGQNVYLYCASEGLATVVRGAIDRAALASALGLKPEQQIVLAQTVGYPKE